MAESLSHKFGQIIGDLLEIAIEIPLQKFAKQHKLYLDKKGSRSARKGKKLSWTDGENNSHDLDFVLEKDGTNDAIGTPLAFIEIAWRRYTKHSRNKAQEIQGAILPLLKKYKHHSPFAGVVLAGEFTEGALQQLKSSGFAVLYLDYKSIILAFSRFGIDVNFDESTPEEDFKRRIKKIETIGSKIKDIPAEILRINQKEVEIFLSRLSNAILRKVDQVIVLPLHGLDATLHTIEEAIQFVEDYSIWETVPGVVRYEIIIKYNNGDRIDAIFNDKGAAINFLSKHD